MREVLNEVDAIFEISGLRIGHLKRQPGHSRFHQMKAIFPVETFFSGYGVQNDVFHRQTGYNLVHYYFSNTFALVLWKDDHVINCSLIFPIAYGASEPDKYILIEDKDSRETVFKSFFQL